MIRTCGAAAICFCLVAVLPYTVAAPPPDGAIRLRVEEPQVIADNPQGAGVLGFTLRYTLRITNVAEAPVDIPDLDSVPDKGASLFLLSLQSQQPDGSWKYIDPGGAVLFTPRDHFAPCRPLGPNQTVVFKNLADRFILQKEQSALLGTQITARATIVVTCFSQPPSKFVGTDPFVLSLPMGK